MTELGTQGVVCAATPWRTNAELIRACARLNYLRPTDRILDPTYGRGVWWKAWQPDAGQLITNDIDPRTATMFHEDFRQMHWPDAQFDAITFDPPYAAHGGRTTSTLPGYNERYGRTMAPATPQGVQALINDGLNEMARLVRPGGLVLVKCQAYIWSGKLWEGDAHTRNHAVHDLAMEVVDRLEHVGRARPQPARSRRDGQPSVQAHARRNLSTMFVFRRVRALDGPRLFDPAGAGS